MVDIPNYYNRFDPAKGYDEHLFLPGRGLQSAELNEVQSQNAYRLKGIADALFKDGDLIRDAGCVVDAETGEARLEGGAVYIRGAVRGVAPATFTIPTEGVVAIGIYLIETVVTELDDPDLRDPAPGTRNFGEAGAYRKQVEAVWGYDGDGQAGEFFPVYEVTDGVLGAKEPPPSLDAITQSIARYDRDSAGGTYIVSGLGVKKQPDDETDGSQVYTISEGRARVFGYGVEYKTGRRVKLTAVPDLKLITNEPHLSSGPSAQWIELDRAPAANLLSVSITAERTVNLTHGVVTGSADPLPDSSVLEIIEVKQGAVTFAATTDYVLDGGRVDWSPAGSEPAPGSTYTVKYRYITLATPTGFDGTGFTVTGAVAGTLVLVTYNQMLPRIDRLCIDSDGKTVWVFGVASEWNPIPPVVPNDLLALATVYQTWDGNRRVVGDAVKVVPMPELAALGERIDAVLGLVAQQRLESNIHFREAGTKKGLFTDPFIDDSQRDAGTEQDAAIVSGELLLPIYGTEHRPSADITVPTTLAHTRPAVISQTLRTGSMKINPYMAFQPTPATLSLNPAIDRWTNVTTVWASATTQRFTQTAASAGTTSTTRSVLLSTTTRPAETLRPIEIRFRIAGFGAGENLQTFTFDGIPVTPVAI